MPAKSTTRKTAARKRPARRIRIRMYRHGLGDCFLLTFPAQKSKEYHILIDCGLIGVAKEPKPMMTAVAENIKAATGGVLDLVVLTHEHWDHVSGFSTQQAQTVFDSMTVRDVWYAWTEDPKSKLGKRLRDERAAKVKAAKKAAKALNDRGMGLQAARVEALLGFFGLGAAGGDGESIGKVRAAFEFLAGKNGVKTGYRYPGEDPLELPGVPGVRVYVLGPPENEALIKRSKPRKSEHEVYEFGSGLSLDDSFLAALEAHEGLRDGADGHLPFDDYFRCHPGGGGALDKLIDETWAAQGNEWRRIDNDWLAAAESLALALDAHTNNTSLALAFELVASGRVLLFVGDAQVGNWRSWQDVKWNIGEGSAKKTVTGPDLLRRTVVYKVGHHGSHNATLSQLGLELMSSDELIALVPVNKEQAVKNRWMEMPFASLLEALGKKTRGRVVHSDIGQTPPVPSTLSDLSKAEQAAFAKAVKPDPGGLFIDVFLPL